jgi:ATP-dependent exoDNAse (exonuclease V) beta subunit
MTVHRAKGLEFPIVILADLTAKEAPGEPSRYSDASRALCAMRLAGCSPPELLAHREDEREREREEAARILYVAATRARDLLVVPVIGDERRDGWLGAMHPVVYPDESRRRQPDATQPAGCPRFGLDSVGERPDRAPGRERSVAPGLHAPEIGDHQVVWWDPATLDLAVDETVGLRQQRLLEADESGATSERGVRQHAAWRATREQVRDAGRVATVRVESATAWALARAEAAATPDAGIAALPIDVTVETARAEATSRTRPHGVRFGVLVHAVLAVVDINGDAAAVTAASALQARLLGTSAEETEAAAAAVTRALAHPLIRRAAAAARKGRCRREVPVAVRLDDGSLIEGVADLAFREDEPTPSWTIVDFKTDLDVAGRLPEYRWQLGAYGLAVARATGLPTRAVVLSI